MTDALLDIARTGSGEPLLLLHGMGTSRRDFAAMAPGLAEDFEVVAMDLPGHGQSPPLACRPTIAAFADAVEATLDAHGLHRVHVLGNSLGGRVAIELAVRGRARSVVAVAPSGMGLPPERLMQASALAAGRIVLRRLAPAIEPLGRSRAGRVALLASLKARPWAASREEAVGLREGFSESHDFWRMLLWGLLLDVPRALKTISCPVTLVQGTRDLLAPGQAVRYLPLVPTARFQPLVLAGHAPQSDRPRTILALVHETAGEASPDRPLRQALAA